MSNETERPSRRFFGLGNFVPRAILYLKGDTGQRGPQGDAATVTVGSTTTLPAGSSASVTNSGTTSAAVLDFSIPQGAKGDPQTPSDATPQMDGAGAAGTATTYARGDHVHPTDTSRASAADVTAIQNVIPSTATPTNKLATAADIPAAPVSSVNTKTGAVVLTGEDIVTGGVGTYASADISVAISDLDSYVVPGIRNSIAAQFDATATYAVGQLVFKGDTLYRCTTAHTGAWDASDFTTATVEGALETKANSSDLATVATTGDYADLTNKPTIPAAQIQSDWNQTNSAAVDYIKNKPSIPSSSDFVAKTGMQTMQGGLLVTKNVSNGNVVAVEADDDFGGAAFVNVSSNDNTMTFGTSASGNYISSSEGNSSGTLEVPVNSGMLALQEAIAPAFSTSSTYAVGDYVTHEGLLYKCTTAVSTAGAWNAANWTAVAVTDEMGADTPLPFDAEVEYVTFPAGAYVDPEIVDIGLPNAYDVQFSMRVGTWGVVNFGNWRGTVQSSFYIYSSGTDAIKLAKYWADSSTTPVPTGSWVDFATRVDGYTVGSTTKAYTPDGSVRAEAKFLIGAFDNTTNGTVEPSYTNVDIAYFRFIGNTVLRDLAPVRVGTVGYLYDKISGRLFGSAVGSVPLVPGPDKAQPTITTPGRIVELTDSPAFTGTPTAPTAAAGTNTTQIATTAFVQTEARYALTAKTPTVSGTAATVACEDRAINDFTIATGITSLTITPPAAATGRARDFFCRVTLTDSSLPTVTLSGATIDIGATEVAGMTQGVNLLMFTEISSGHWLASRRSAS